MEEEFSRFRWEESDEAALEKLEVKPRLAILDLADESSIDDCVKQVEKEVGRVDILILNGAFAAPKDAPPKDFARMMIKTNNFGCHKALQSFRALLAPGARVLVVASGFGTLEGLPDDLRARLDTSKMSYEELHGLLEEYVVACEEERDPGAQGLAQLREQDEQGGPGGAHQDLRPRGQGPGGERRVPRLDLDGCRSRLHRGLRRLASQG